MNEQKKKNMVIIVAMIAVLVIGAISAYFTATDSVTNTFTVGSIEIDTSEPAWDDENAPDGYVGPDHGDKYSDDDGDGVPDSQQITPNHEFNKDPQVTNKGENDAYVYTMVAVPKKSVRVAYTSNGDTDLTADEPGAGTNANGSENQMTQIFQLNKIADDEGEVRSVQMQEDQDGRGSYSAAGILQPATTNNAKNNAKSWTGVDTFNDDEWYLLAVNPGEAGSVLEPYQEHYNIYLFAYAKSTDGRNATLTKLQGKRQGKANRDNSQTGDGSGTQGNDDPAPAKGQTTGPLFRSVTIANMVNINDLISPEDEDSIAYNAHVEFTMPQILIKSFAIQCDNLSAKDTTDAAEVWSILNNQNGAYAALVDELEDIDAEDSSWQTPGE